MCSKAEQPDKQRVTIFGLRESFDEVQESVLDLMRQNQYCDHDLFSVRVAFEEALANAVLHGHQGDTTSEIDVLWSVTNKFVEIEVVDQGRGYDPKTIPDPTANENLTLPSGRGLAMIRAFMNEVHINERGNHLRMVRHKDQNETQ
jgi:serine/threonine-protein kinase RsbW